VLRRIVVRPQQGWRPLDLVEIWHYRELLWILALRDIKVRYKQTSLGVAWAIIQPFFTMIVFTMISRLGNIPTEGVPPQVFYYAGMLPWLLFSNSLTSAGNSLLGSQNLITKVYFPRLIIPVASVLTGLIDFGIAFVALLVIMAWYHVAPGAGVVLLPVYVGLAFLAALGVGLFLSALNVQFRDVRYAIPFLTQLWLFATPILYSSSSVTVEWKRSLLGLNPMSGVVEGFRGCMLGRPVSLPMLAVSSVMIVSILIASLFYFRRMEHTFADRV
jgi:lipopolysaccharide transport system permease protein